MATQNAIGSAKPIEVAFGGTGAATFTDGGVLVGATTGAMEVLAVGTDGQVLVGSSAANPVFATITSTDGSITFTPTAGALVIEGTAAGEAQVGVVELATDAEAIAGTASTVINCTSLKAKLGAQTSHGLPYGAASTGAIVWTAEPTDGQLLIGDTGGVPVLGTITAGTNMTITNAPHAITASSTLVELNDQTGTTYTLVLADAGKLVTLTNNAAITLTVPKNSAVAYPTGTTVSLFQGGAGLVTVAPVDGDVTLRSPGAALDLNGQYTMAAVVKIDTDVWVLAGDIA